MSMQRLGKAFVKSNGSLFESLPGAKIDIGGVTRNPVVGSNSVHGYAEQVKEATVECEISFGPDTRLVEIAAMSDVTINFECDTGQVYVVRNAWLVEPPVLTEGEGGKVPLKFAGPPADET